LTADKDSDYDAICANLARCFFHIDEPDIKAKEFNSILQRHFVDGCFDPAFRQFLWLHARTDDFETTMGKARQYMDVQEQAKISAVAKKPNVCLATSEPESNQIQPILDGLQKVLQTVLENQNQNQKPDVKTGTASNSGNGNVAKKKGRNHQTMWPVIVRTLPRGRIDVPVMRIRDAKIHLPKEWPTMAVSTRIRVSVHQGIRGLTALIAGTGTPSRTKDRAPGGIVDFPVTTDHLRAQLT